MVITRKLFAKAWMKELGITEVQPGATPMWQMFAIGFLSPLVMAALLAWISGATGLTGIESGAWLGLLAAVCFVAAGGAPHYAFSGKSLRLFLIDMGHSTAVLVVLGAIVGGWR